MKVTEMFECYDENKIIVKAYLIKELPKEIIENKKFTCPCCEEDISFIKEYYKPKGLWRAHFSHKRNNNCSGYTPEGESKEHYIKKMEILDDLHNKEIEIQTHGLKWKFNKELVDYIAEEKYEINGRRADIIVRLKKPNVILGNGIAIEIMISEKEESINLKRKDYALQLYSVATLNENGEIEIQLTYPEVLTKVFKETMNTYKEEINLYENKFKFLRQDFINKAIKHNLNCLNCAKATINKYNPTEITCWLNYNEKTKKGYNNKADFTPCGDYSKSNKPDIVVEDYEQNVCSHMKGDEE